MNRYYTPRALKQSGFDLTPAEDRTVMFITILVGLRSHTPVDVTAKETCCQVLAVNPSPILGPIRGFNITHIPSGHAMIEGLPDERTAEVCAGAIARIFDWKVEEENRDIRRRFAMLPANLQNWIKNWRFL